MVKAERTFSSSNISSSHRKTIEFFWLCRYSRQGQGEGCPSEGYCLLRSAYSLHVGLLPYSLKSYCQASIVDWVYLGRSADWSKIASHLHFWCPPNALSISPSEILEYCRECDLFRRIIYIWIFTVRSRNSDWSSTTELDHGTHL